MQGCMLRPVSVVEQVHETVKGRIISGEYAAGALLSEVSESRARLYRLG